MENIGSLYFAKDWQSHNKLISDESASVEQMWDNILVKKIQPLLQVVVFLGCDVTVLQPRVDGSLARVRPGRRPLQLPESVPADELSFLKQKRGSVDSAKKVRGELGCCLPVELKGNDRGLGR